MHFIAFLVSRSTFKEKWLLKYLDEINKNVQFYQISRLPDEGDCCSTPWLEIFSFIVVSSVHSLNMRSLSEYVIS